MEVIPHRFAVPALHGQLLEDGGINDPPPATSITHEQPVRKRIDRGGSRPGGGTGLGGADRIEAGSGEASRGDRFEPAQLTQGGRGLQHPEAAAANILHPDFTERLLNLQNLALVARGPKAKPTKQHQPGSAQATTAQQQHGSQTKREEGEEAAAAIGHHQAPPPAAGDLPHKGLHHQAAVEGQAGQKIEQGKHQVEHPQLGDHLAQHRGLVGGWMHSGQECDSQRQAHQRTGQGDSESAEGRGTFAFDAGDATQQEQGDAAHPHALAEGHKGVAQFVEHH